MILRRQRTGYNVKHMISPQPPFEKELMRLFVSQHSKITLYLVVFLPVQIYDNGAVSFGNRLGRGSPNITATGNLSFENVEVNFFVNPSNRQLSIRRDQILNLLKRNETEGAERFNPKNMVVVTWTNVRLTTCDKVTYHLKHDTSADNNIICDHSSSDSRLPWCQVTYQGMRKRMHC